MERALRIALELHLLRTRNAHMGTAVREVGGSTGGNARSISRGRSPSHAAAALRLAAQGRLKRYGIVYQKQVGRSPCFIVSVRRRGRMYTRRFASSKHGGLGAALEAAITWRNRWLVTTPVFTLREFHTRLRSNNTSGVPGVTFLRPSNQPDGLWQAKISLADGRRFSRKFSVRKFGEAEAFARAVAARSEFLAAIPEKPYVVDPIAKRLSASNGRHEMADL